MIDFSPKGKKIVKSEQEFLNKLNLRWCSKCRAAKGYSDFYGKSKLCKECCSKKMEKYRKTDNFKKWQSSPEAKTANAIARKKYYSLNAEKIKEKRKREYKENLEASRKYQREWAKRERQNNSNYKIKSNCSRRIRKSLHLQMSGSKADCTIDLIGCSINELKIHLESQFKEGMSWANYGNPNGDHSNCWHIDHIVPCASFDLSDPEQQKKCFHFTNLQPLWASENMSKSDSLPLKV